MANRKVFGRGLIIWWWLALIAAAPLYFRLLWEQTFLTWQRGPQMIGFSLGHQHPEVLFLGLVGYVAMCAWLTVAFAIMLRRRELPKGVQATYLSVTVAAVLIALVPYGFWASLGGVSVQS